MVESLLKTGKHQVTSITRADSKSEQPSGVQAAKVNFDDHSELVSALKGHDALIITLAATAPAEQQERLIRAAADAGIKWVLPNEWGLDTQDVEFGKKSLVGTPKQKIYELFKSLGGKSDFIAVCTGFWYEWSLAIDLAFGFNFEKKTVTFFGDGDVKINSSTWPQVGRAVAALLSLPITAEGDEPSLEKYKNKHVYVSSFLISQKDIFESVLRVTETKPEDWTITHEDCQERYDAALEQMKTGDKYGFGKAMYTSVFFPDGKGNTEKRYGLLNEVLGLPKEDMDEATKAAIERSKVFKW